MTSVAAVLCALALSAVPADDQEKAAPERPPQGPGPTCVYVSAVDPAAGKFSMVRTITVNVPVQVQRQVIRNGVPVGVTVTEFQTQTQVRQETFSVPATAFYTTAGKKLDAAEAQKRLRPGAVVVKSSDGRPVDPAYLSVFRPETLVVVFPNEGRQPGLPPVVPVPPPAVAPPPAAPPGNQ